TAHFDDLTNSLSLFHDATPQLGGLNVGVHNDGQPFVLTSETMWGDSCIPFSYHRPRFPEIASLLSQAPYF
ncbi:hypothetical protein M404DRAFT_1009246, partial [Pisolithus tinctorius Marx 270]